MDRFHDKVCMITGGGGGIGRATALSFAHEGAQVVVTDLDVEAGAAVAQEINAAQGDGRALYLPHEVTSPAEWDSVIAAVLARYERLDVLVNNAGILIKGSIEDATLEQWHKLLRVNTDSAFLGCQAAVRVMKGKGGGAIVNVSSITGLSARSDYVGYVASKHAMLGLSRAVAIHCRQKRYGIRCNSVHPDGVLTAMTLSQLPPGVDAELLCMDRDPMQRQCRPQDVADAILFLASAQARAINGTELRVDGGQLLMSL
ncbi:MAG: glucose 1-dehydrogenase [Betaproteobacteria bacterium]|nr:glucose 1-dehydrogenase [Betaproteobacteria bacterium]